ncbi:MAG: aldehyde dehydrogenase family protein [Parvularculaceae bacterium]
MASFTGGAKTGIALHKAFADKLEKIIALELGGNNPLIWWDTDDIDAAAFTVVQVGFPTSGPALQTCATPGQPEGDSDRCGDRRVGEIGQRIIVGAPFDEPHPFIRPG